MSGITGKGGYIKRDGVTIAGVIDYDWAENDDAPFGQYGNSVSARVKLTDSSTLIRKADTFDAELKLSEVRSDTLTMTNCRVTENSIPVMNGDAVVQSITFVNHSTAT